jgi:hypothetical protein
MQMIVKLPWMVKLGTFINAVPGAATRLSRATIIRKVLREKRQRARSIDTVGAKISEQTVEATSSL